MEIWKYMKYEIWKIPRLVVFHYQFIDVGFIDLQ